MSISQLKSSLVRVLNVVIPIALITVAALAFEGTTFWQPKQGEVYVIRTRADDFCINLRYKIQLVGPNSSRVAIYDNNRYQGTIAVGNSKFVGFVPPYILDKSNSCTLPN